MRVIINRLALKNLAVMSGIRMRTYLLILVSLSLPAAMIEGGYWVEAVVTAYSPHDAIDSDYHLTKGKDRWRTAAMVDVREQPYGVAVPHSRGVPSVPYGSRIYIPQGHGYLDSSRRHDRWFTADDTGGIISQRTRTTGTLHIDLRYKTEYSALKFGRKTMLVYILPLGN